MAREHNGVQAVIALHDDLAAWMGHGNENAWQRFLAALAPDFVQVTPGGTCHTRNQVVEAVAALGGGYGHGFKIRIADASARTLGSAVAVIYREVQSGGPRAAADRTATALMVPAPDGRLLWHHLHETWCAVT